MQNWFQNWGRCREPVLEPPLLINKCWPQNWGPKCGPCFGTQNWAKVLPKSRPTVAQLCARGGAIFGTLPSPASHPLSWGLRHASGRRCSHVAHATAGRREAQLARAGGRAGRRGAEGKLVRAKLDGSGRCGIARARAAGGSLKHLAAGAANRRGARFPLTLRVRLCACWPGVPRAARAGGGGLSSQARAGVAHGGV